MVRPIHNPPPLPLEPADRIFAGAIGKNRGPPNPDVSTFDPEWSSRCSAMFVLFVPKVTKKKKPAAGEGETLTPPVSAAAAAGLSTAEAYLVFGMGLGRHQTRRWLSFVLVCVVHLSFFLCAFSLRGCQFILCALRKPEHIGFTPSSENVHTHTPPPMKSQALTPTGAANIL